MFFYVLPTSLASNPNVTVIDVNRCSDLLHFLSSSLSVIALIVYVITIRFSVCFTCGCNPTVVKGSTLSDAIFQTTMSKSPITVQQWVESLPPPHTTISSFYSSPLKNTRKFLPRELSLQSDDASSHCSSVESVLELRKPDPEAVLLGLGFGPSKSSQLVSKIPARFLQPSKVLTQIDFDKFLEQYGGAKCPNPTAPASPAKTQPKSC